MSTTDYIPIQGGNLGNADATINPAADVASLYVLPAATLTGDHTLVLGTGATPKTNAVVHVVRADLTAHSYLVNNGGPGTGTLFTFGPSATSISGSSFYFDGTNWKYLSTYVLAVNAPTVTVDGTTITGDGSFGNPLIAASQFGANTSVPVLNSALNPVTALQLIASLTTGTAGSEVSQWLLKLLQGGAQTSKYTFKNTGLDIDTADGATNLNITFLSNGTEQGQVGCSSGQLLLTATQSGGGIRLFDGVSTEVLRISTGIGFKMFGLGMARAQGVDTASANNLSTPPTSGDSFVITGVTQINLIDNSLWQKGADVTYTMTGNPTFKNNQSPSSTFLPMLLKGRVDYVAAAGDVITFRWLHVGGVDAWYEVSRITAA